MYQTLRQSSTESLSSSGTDELESAVEDLYNAHLKAIEKKLGTGITTGGQLLRMANTMFPEKVFRGVFAQDQVPELKSGEMVIFNLDRHGQPGSHWCVLAKSADNLRMYDSFARRPSEIITDIDSITEWDDDQDQDLMEDNCGQRCLAFMMVWYVFGDFVSGLI